MFIRKWLRGEKDFIFTEAVFLTIVVKYTVHGMTNSKRLMIQHDDITLKLFYTFFHFELYGTIPSRTN